MKFKHGYRLLMLGWTDSCTFLPINFSLQASAKEENVLGPHGNVDKRSIAGKRRFMACRKSTEVMVGLLRTALSAGHRAKYVLFESCFSNPSQISAIKDLGMNVIAMVKRSSNRTYLFEEKQLNIKKIFSSCKKRRGRSRYLLSVAVTTGRDNEISARIVCVRNRNNRKDWIAIWLMYFIS